MTDERLGPRGVERLVKDLQQLSSNFNLGPRSSLDSPISLSPPHEMIECPHQNSRGLGCFCEPYADPLERREMGEPGREALWVEEAWIGALAGTWGLLPLFGVREARGTILFDREHPRAGHCSLFPHCLSCSPFPPPGGSEACASVRSVLPPIGRKHFPNEKGLSGEARKINFQR